MAVEDAGQAVQLQIMELPILGEALEAQGAVLVME
jgi:hypothetical protein